MRRMVIPVLLGLCAVIYLIYQQFDPEEFAKISWTRSTWSWLGLAVLTFMIRHLAYSYRLWILSDRFFTYWKCVKLIVIWEFSSAVSPSSVGGAVVSIFALSQEDYPAGKTAALVIYTIVQDTIFFLLTLPILFFVLGPNIIRPNITDFASMDIYGFWFLAAYTFMVCYGIILSYGLFVNPEVINRFLLWLTGFKWTRRFRAHAIDVGRDLVAASAEYKSREWGLHIRSFFATSLAWTTRFLIVAFIIVGMVESVPPAVSTLAHLYGRLEAMFSIILFIPTPGGAGVVEYLFGGFLSDYVPIGIAVVVATVWRLLTYYSYLILGALIIPPWLNRVLARKSS